MDSLNVGDILVKKRGKGKPRDSSGDKPLSIQGVAICGTEQGDNFRMPIQREGRAYGSPRKSRQAARSSTHAALLFQGAELLCDFCTIGLKRFVDHLNPRSVGNDLP